MKLLKKLQNIIHKELTVVILFIFIIAFQLCRMVNIYSSGNYYLCDEVYSYGLSNSFYMPSVELSDFKYDDQTHFTNINEWKSGEILHNYLTVQKGQQFRYDSVWYNQSLDRHPPLFYAVLHTVFSFFPDTFSYWIAFSLNAVCFTVSQIFLYLMMKNVLKSKYLALLVCLFWGITSVAVNLVLFIRMYCMLVMWVIMFLYFTQRFYQNPAHKNIIPVIVTSTCGLLTQHLFLFIAFITAVCFCLKFLIDKKFKIFFIYGFSMVGSVLLSFAVFPPAVSQIFSEAQESYPSVFLKQLFIGYRYLSLRIFGFTLKDLIIWLPYVLCIELIVFIFSIPIQFLFRNNDKLKNFYKNSFSFVKNIKITSFPKLLVKNISPLFVSAFLSVIVVLCITSYKMNFLFDNFIIRYMFVICPLIVIVFVWTVWLLLSKFGHRKGTLALVLALCTVISAIKTSSVYQETLERSITNIDELVQDSQCIVIEPEKDFLAVFCIMPKELINADSFFLTYFEAVPTLADELKKADKNKPLYLLLSEMSDEGYNDLGYTDNDDFLKVIRNIYQCDTDYIGNYRVPNTNYLVYELH